MSDADRVRALPLSTVLGWLGFSMEQFHRRPRKPEWFGKCILHTAKTNDTSFSFTDELYHCFSCKAKGKGAINLVMACRFLTFTRAVEWLAEKAGSNPTASILPVTPPKGWL
jgi:DNA primase